MVGSPKYVLDNDSIAHFVCQFFSIALRFDWMNFFGPTNLRIILYVN